MALSDRDKYWRLEVRQITHEEIKNIKINTQTGNRAVVQVHSLELCEHCKKLR